jgi:hypothetical protein
MAIEKWEYRVIRFRSHLPEGRAKIDYGQGPPWEEELNELGLQGWELVSVVKVSEEEFKPVAFLKRWVR